MGGGGSESAAAVEEVIENPAFTGQMRTFGVGMPTTVQNQLNSAGLGGMIDPSQFQQTTMPILTNPNDLKLYLQSLGIAPTEVGATSTTTSTDGFSRHTDTPEG